MKAFRECFVVFLLMPIIFWADINQISVIHGTSINKFPSNYFLHKENRIFFFTQQRTATNWMLYILQSLTSRPVISGSTYSNVFKLPMDFEKPAIHFWHGAYDLLNFLKEMPRVAPFNRNKDKVITIVRNPTETCCRGAKNFDDALHFFHHNIGMTHLYQNLSFYDASPVKNRLLIYYEDLIAHPQETLQELLNFLDEPSYILDDFMSNYEERRTYCIQLYERWYGTRSTGNNIDFHQKFLSYNQKKHLQTLIKNKDLNMWNKYLKRYEIE